MLKLSKTKSRSLAEVQLGQVKSNKNLVLIGTANSQFEDFLLSKPEKKYLRSEIESGKSSISINQYNRWIFIQLIKSEETLSFEKESMRKAACTLNDKIVDQKLKDVIIIDVNNNPDIVLAFIEGLFLSNYQFLNYLKDKEKKEFSLTNVEIFSESIGENELSELQILSEAVFSTRDLVNQPLSYLNSSCLADEIKILGKKAGFSVKVFGKEKIEELKMGGLLAVNKGSIDPPTFSILEWKPEKQKNKKPVVLVGKGIVYDTGGLSLKPTPNSMDLMKSDMAGAAAVAGTLYAMAKSKLPVHIIGLIPATDNRPDGNAYVPGDIVKMFNGLNVEVLNTDAEGRMILADALSYAKKYDPEIVIDIATLTGAAEVAVGKIGIVAMGTAKQEIIDKLAESGLNVYERIVQFPLWNEYAELIKSDIADLKNIGGKYAGAITAGKFLENFTDYPWIHLDIAGTAFLTTKDSYRGKGGTGTTVRLLFDYLKNFGEK